MTKIIKRTLILFALVALICLLFPMVYSHCASNAAVEGVSGNKIVLTGLIDGTYEHAFKDENKQSTLVNSKLDDIQDKYYSIVSSGKGTSSGWAEFKPTNDMLSFIEKGLLYAEASGEVTGKNGTKVTIQISSGDAFDQVSGDSGEINTGRIQVKSGQNIRFTFSTSSTNGKNNFTLSLPTIHIYTIINSITLNEESRIVYPGQIINISAFNDVTSLPKSEGNFMSFSKINHKIEIDVTSGGNYVKLLDTASPSLVILSNAPSGAVIKFRVYSKKTSYSSELIYSSNEASFTVNANQVAVSVQTDFDDHPFIDGDGLLYTPGKRFTLRVSQDPDFQFLGWYGLNDNNEEVLLSEADYLVSNAYGQVIYAKFIKSVTIKQIIVPDKVYDKTTAIPQEQISAIFDGVESKHDVKLLGSEFAFGDANAGDNKLIVPIEDDITAEDITLTGANAGLYTLKAQIFSASYSNSYGRILKRDALVIPENTQKQYGYTDPSFNYTVKNVLDGDTIVGDLGRLSGEEIGTYPYSQGNLGLRNPNYNVTIESSSYFEIIPRELSLENVIVEEKIYDQTTMAQISASLRNIFNNEDVYVSVEGEFVSPNAGNVEVLITDAKLFGEDKEHYTLVQYSQKLFGQINPSPIDVQAEEASAIYGDKIIFNYMVTGLYDGDELSGELAIKDKNVGKHEITEGTLGNSNYYIENFTSAICTITPREIQVYADKMSKVYGDEDDELTYATENMVEGDSLQGKLSRQDGEDVGVYEIEIGDLNNSNYIISFTKNEFIITERLIETVIEFLDKEYDGTNQVKYDVEYKNNVKNESFNLVLEASLSRQDCGTATVDYKIPSVDYSGTNYIFTYQFKNSQIQILRRQVNIFVDDISKTYGDGDPEFTYSVRNLIGNDTLDLTINREDGEVVGQYGYSMKGDYSESYPNYAITLVESYFKILPREVMVEIGAFSKVFGDEDPAIEYNIIDNFCFNDTRESVVDGKITREEGEMVGVYKYDLAAISSNQNYIFINVNNSYFIINKKPVIVKIKDATKVYGEDDPVFEYDVEYEVDGEKLSVEITRDYSEDVGDHTLVCKMKNDSRYIISYEEGTLKITPYSIAVKADDKVKVYGEEDPEFTISITEGVLRNNDRLEDLIQGRIIRAEGESAEDYEIKLDKLSLGKNYELKRESGKLVILPRHLTITADPITKYYGEQDPELTYKVSSEGLVYNDKIEGSLIREAGEDVREYKILQGGISLSKNYELEFIEGKFNILKKDIQIIPTTLSKEYGDEDKTIEYKLVGELVGEDTLSGELYRDGVGEKEEVGKYLIYSTLDSPNYQINMGEHYFTILPREIVVKAISCQIYYGGEEPQLDYQIVSGTVLEGDDFTGGLSRQKGNTAGTYDIISSLSLGRNYTIQFIKGTVTILPLDLTIKSPDYQKIYGQEDPTFTYEIVEGKLINNDKLYGTIIREKGEDVGIYNLEKGIYNANYNITLLPAKFEIIKKDVYMISSVYNKIYDGTTEAKLKNPYVSGIFDNVYLDYEQNNSATFLSAEVGEHVGVKVHDVMLVGEKAGNYNLVLPELLYADITLQDIAKEEVYLAAKDPVLYSRYSLEIASEDISSEVKVKNHSFVKKYNIWLEDGVRKINPESQYTIKIELPKKIFSKYNIYVYQKDEAGNYKMLATQKDANNEIVISSYSLGEFYVAVEDESWLDIGAIVAISLIAVTFVVAVVYTVIKQKRKRKIYE